MGLSFAHIVAAYRLHAGIGQADSAQIDIDQRVAIVQPHIGRAISEWLLDQDEVDELYAEDGVIVETIRRNMPQR